MGQPEAAEITRFAHEGETFESVSKDFDFSRRTIREHIRLGYEHAGTVLARQAAAAGSCVEARSGDTPGGRQEERTIQP